MKNVYLHIVDELQKNHSLVLGTLLNTRGSAPQVPGASAIFNSEGLIFGTLGGGIMEGEAVKLAKEAVVTGNNVFKEYSLNAGINDEYGAICGGNATYLLDANPVADLSVFKQIKKSIDNHASGVLLTIINSSDKFPPAVSRIWLEEDVDNSHEICEKYKIDKKQIDLLIRTRGSQILKSEEQETGIIVFAESVYPKPELIIAGAGHIGQALCHQAFLNDFDVTVIDNRPELANSEKLPDANRIIVENVGIGIKSLKPGINTYIVIVTRGHNDDAEALKSCIKSDVAYIGMVGSKRKTALMREKFIEEGLATENELNRIYAPIGIDILSKTVQEIAVSIIAQLIKVRREKSLNKGNRPVWCVVLAAGESKRMKQQKMLMPYRGKTIIETVVKRAVDSNTEKVLVVLGSDKEKVKKQIGDREVTFAVNKNFSDGMLSSVQCGVNELPLNAGAVIILLGDQPMVSTEIINKLIEVFKKSKKGIIIPSYKGKRGHPILIDLKYMKEINKLNPEIGLRELIMSFPDDIIYIEADSNDVLKDIDTPEDYYKELKQQN